MKTLQASSRILSHMQSQKGSSRKEAKASEIIIVDLVNYMLKYTTSLNEK
jgi:hypothetical protein